MQKQFFQESLIFGDSHQKAKTGMFFGVAFLMWTACVVLFLFWAVSHFEQRLFDSARVQARTAIEKDILYRRWNSMHGGVYAPVSKVLTPNPYLDVADRDIVSSDGRKLTKINPAYMTRQVHELGMFASGVVGHITSLNPIRPGNKADDWEEQALKRMESKPDEVSVVQDMEGKKFFRLMVPLMTEKSCLHCHEKQGYKIGDIRGGISVSVPLEPLFESASYGRSILISSIIVAWLLGGLVILGIVNLKKTEIRLRSSEEKYRTLVETMSEGLLILDRDSKIIFCNPPFANMLGYEPDSLLQTPITSYLDFESNDEYSRKVDQLTSGRYEPFELTLLKKSGGLVTVLFSPRTIRSESLIPLGLLAVTTDISSLKKMEKEVLRQQRLSSVGMLAGGVAHEISAPLEYLKANSTFLRRAFDSFYDFIADMESGRASGVGGSALEAKMKKHQLDNIIKEIPVALEENDVGIARISDIVDSIHKLVRTGPVDPELEDLNALIRKCVDVTRNSWAEVAELDLDLSPDLPSVKCISRDINQVLITVIMNAVDSISLQLHRDSKPGKGAIRIATGKLGAELRIVISDNGTGISDDDLSRIFEPFFTTKRPGKGTGQGLAVARRIMTDHGGDITAESFSGRGAVFVLNLPVEI